jgi:hypothetical protein
VAQPTLFPPGPPTAPSGRMGTGTEITMIPYLISVPGSYYLSMTLTQAALGDKITIDASDVTIDLMGQALIGVGLPGDSAIEFGPGIYANVTIHDGFITDWGDTGLDLFAGGGGPVPNIHVYNVTSTGNAGDGISVGPQAIVRHVICSSNTLAGLRADRNVKITNAICAENGAEGIFVGGNGHVSDSVVVLNGAAFGSAGMFLGFNSVVIGSVAADNAADGYFLDANCRATDCVASFNGFVVGFGNGFFCIENDILGGCAAYNNADSGFFGLPMPAPGPGAPGGNSAHDCTAEFNGFATFTGDGFTEFRSVTQCTAQSNAENGIQCGFASHVVRNTCEANLVSGIVATGDGNSIQQNHVAYNGLFGIDTTFNPGPPGNLLLSNTGHLNFGGVDFFLAFGIDTWGPIFFGPGALPAGGAGFNISYP